MKKYPRILRWKQSPMDARRWCVELSCGHEKWITRDRPPKSRVTEECPHGCMREGQK